MLHGALSIGPFIFAPLEPPRAGAQCANEQLAHCVIWGTAQVRDLPAANPRNGANDAKPKVCDGGKRFRGQRTLLALSGDPGVSTGPN